LRAIRTNLNNANAVTRYEPRMVYCFNLDIGLAGKYRSAMKNSLPPPIKSL